MEDDVVAEGIDVFRVNQEAIHIKEASADFGKAEVQVSRGKS